MQEKIISFDGLGIGPIQFDRVAFSIGDFAVYWYAIIISFGLILALGFCLWQAKKFDLTTDNILDVLLYGLPVAIICARAYYVIFSPASVKYESFFDMIDIRNGGLAIYGGIIGAFATGAIYCKLKKVNMLAMFDIASFGFLIGQSIGRWGNFVNGEAYGSITKLPWGMTINGRGPFHPTFFYEFLWNVIGFVLLYIFVKKWKKHHGEAFFLYMAWYGLGRFFIEGLRADSLMLGSIRVSQIVAAVAFAFGIVMFVLSRKNLLTKAKEKAKENAKIRSERRYKPVYTSLYSDEALSAGTKVEQLGEASMEDVEDDRENATPTEEGETENG